MLAGGAINVLEDIQISPTGFCEYLMDQYMRDEACWTWDEWLLSNIAGKIDGMRQAASPKVVCSQTQTFNFSYVVETLFHRTVNMVGALDANEDAVGDGEGSLEVLQAYADKAEARFRSGSGKCGQNGSTELLTPQ